MVTSSRVLNVISSGTSLCSELKSINHCGHFSKIHIFVCFDVDVISVKFKIDVSNVKNQNISKNAIFLYGTFICKTRNLPYQTIKNCRRGPSPHSFELFVVWMHIKYSPKNGFL